MKWIRVLAPLFALTTVAASEPPLPAAPMRNAPETFFGTTVDDPYRPLENVKDPAVARWMKAMSDRAHATLERLPGRQGLYERIVKYDEAVPERVGRAVRVPGDRLFFDKRGVHDNQLKLYVRAAGRDRLLVDPDAIAKRLGKPYAINWFAPSPDGRRVAYGMSEGGSEAAVMHVLDVASGKDVGAPIDRADFGAVSWAPDGKSLVFNRLQPLSKGMAPTEKYQKSQVLLLPVGAPAAKARPVFGTAIAGLPVQPAEIPAVTLTADGRWALGFAFNGTAVEIAGLFVAPQAGVLAGRPQWQRLFDAGADVSQVDYFDDTLYLRTHKDAPRSKLLALDLKQPDLANAKTIVPQSERVITGLGAAADALYVEERDGNVKKLFKRAYAADAQPVEVKLPVEGSFELVDIEGGAAATDPRLPGALLDLQSWTRARQFYLVAADGSVSNTGLQPQGPYDAPADVVATEVKVKSYDGAMVPMSIIHKKDVKLDGNNPTVLYGYASYGITEEPYYAPSRLAWLDAGGVWAVANPRGSSVYGQDWYKAGFQATKPNTWRDFIACAEWLVANRWTKPARLGILGGSAGGILVGRAMTERPDLFAAVIPAVGLLDTVRAETTPNGIPNIPEFGTRKTEAGFRALLEMSTYHHIKDGVKYPAVLLTAGVNDPRVEVWHSTKTAARLVQAQKSLPGGGSPVLLRLDYEAGHGIGSTKKQVLAERADMYAFMLWQMGDPAFQPKEEAK